MANLNPFSKVIHKQADRTTDEDFDLHVKNFTKQQAAVMRLQKEFKNYYECLKVMQIARRSLMDTVSELYEPCWDGVEEFLHKSDIFNLSFEDFCDTFNIQILSPVSSYMGQFPEINNKISKRNRKLLDYDNSRHNLQNLETMKKKEDAILAKAKIQLEDARNNFDTLNKELNDELPTLYDGRVEFFATHLQCLFASESSYHTKDASVSSEIGELLGKLKKGYEEGAFAERNISNLESSADSGAENSRIVFSSPSSSESKCPDDSLKRPDSRAKTEMDSEVEAVGDSTVLKEMFEKIQEDHCYTYLGEGETSASQRSPESYQLYIVDNHELPSNSLGEHSDLNVPLQDSQNLIQPKRNKRKRFSNPEVWKDNIRKANKARGLAYVSRSGKLRGAKLIGEPCHCPRKCYDKISNEERQTIHDEFYKLSPNLQNQVIANNIIETLTKKEVRNEGTKRKHVRKYFLDIIHGKVEVCQKMFTSTYAISEKKVIVVADKKRSSKLGVVSPDARGKHLNHKKIDKEVREAIRDHIRSFPTYTKNSYCQEKNAKKYLSPDLSIAKMYRFYVENCYSEGKIPAKHCFYSRIFNEDFNLALQFPKTNTCTQSETP